MRFAFSEEQDELRRGARRFLTAASSPERVRAAMGTERGWDEEVWRRVSGELGWTALAIPEAYGGFGFGWVEIAAVMEEAGRALFCAPLLSSTCLAASAIGHASEAMKAALLPGLADGSRTATIAFGGASRRDAIAARREGAEIVLDGVARHVLDGATATTLVVEARLDGRDEVVVVDGGAAGVTRRATPTMDATRRHAEVRFDGARGAPLGADSKQAIGGALDHARVALAAESVGGAERCLEMAVEYAKTRQQFGRPIGSFQAVKHKLADVLVRVESARSAAYYAAWAAANRPSDLPVAAAMAKAYCADAFFLAASESIQVHGGIGFTWEHDAHLFFKRARANEALFGEPSAMREVVAAHVVAAPLSAR